MRRDHPDHVGLKQGASSWPTASGKTRNSRAPSRSRSGIGSTRCASTAGCANTSKAIEGPLTVLQFKGGQSNPTYRLDTPSRSYVMRRKPFGKLLPSAHAVDREFRSSQRLASRAFRSRSAYALCTDDSVIGAAFYIMSMEEGRVFWDPTLPSQTPEDAAQDLHQQDRDAGETAQLRSARRSGSAISASPAIISRARSTAGPSSTAPPKPQHIPEMEKLIEWLPQTVPEQERVSIVHGDYRLDNMIFHADRAAGAGGAGLGAVDARRSHGRLHLSADAVDRCRVSKAPISRRSTFRRMEEAAQIYCNVTGERRCRISTGILPTTCSGSPASRKASPAASATAPRPTPRRWSRPAHRAAVEGVVGVRAEGGRE